MLALVLAASLPAYQAGPPPDRPALEFGVDVRMIRLDVSVVDGRGRPIAGLAAGDFEVLEDGKPVEVALFEAIHDGTLALPTPEGGLVITALEPQARVGQRILLLVDTAGMTYGQLVRAREGAARFITDAARAGDWVRLLNLATGQVWDGAIPDDRLALAQVARQLLPRASAWSGSPATEGIVQITEGFADAAPGVSEVVTRGQSLSIFAQAAGLLGTLEALLVQLDGVEGRKALVLVSPGFPQLLGLDQRLERVASLARLASTTVYFVDAAGFDGLLPEPGGRMVPAFEAAWSRSGGAMDLAAATGGFTSRFSNNLLPALARVGEEMRSYYVVGYVPPRADDGRFRSVKVKVNLRGASARTKKGYLAGNRRRTP